MNKLEMMSALRAEHNSEEEFNLERTSYDPLYRGTVKNKCLIKYLIGSVVISGSLYLLVALPLMAFSSEIGRAIYLGLVPTWAIAASWMVAGWWAWDRGPSVLYGVTIGMAPLRIIMYSAWVVMVIGDHADVTIVVLSSIIQHFILMIPLSAMFLEYNRKLKPLLKG